VRWHLHLFAMALIGAIPALSPAQSPLTKSPDTATCGEFGTSVHFEKSPKDAAKKALKEEKLVMVLHVSGLFEEPDFT
jgi:hypothetical protein